MSITATQATDEEWRLPIATAASPSIGHQLFIEPEIKGFIRHKAWYDYQASQSSMRYDLKLQS